MANPEEGRAPTSVKSGAATVTETPSKAQTATAAAKKASEGEVDPGKVRRRIIWTCIWGFLAANLLMFMRFFFPRALFEPSTICDLGPPSDYLLGVSDRFKQRCRIYVVREPTRIFAIFAKCTHLGCTPDWKPSENKFKCPCHGSGYTPEGINFEGPAPRPMDRAHIEIDSSGRMIADTSRLYSWYKSQGGKDEFEDPGAYIQV